MAFKKNGGAAPAADDGEGEEQDESQDVANPKDDDTQHEQGGESDADDGTEGAEGGESSGDDGKEGEGAEGEAGEQEPAWVGKVLERLESLEGKKGGGNEDAGDEFESLALPRLNEGALAKIEENYGVNAKQFGLMQNMVNLGIKRLFEHFGGKLGDMSKGSAIDQMAADTSGKFKDIQKYRKSMDVFLQKFSAKERSNREVLELAFWAAKGQGAPADVRRASQGTESNRRIAERRPEAPAGGKRDKGVKPLTPLQESARKAANMSETEYRKYMAKSPRRNR